MTRLNEHETRTRTRCAAASRPPVASAPAQLALLALRSPAAPVRPPERHSCRARLQPALCPHLKIEHRENLLGAATAVTIEPLHFAHHAVLVEYAHATYAGRREILLDQRLPWAAHPLI